MRSMIALRITALASNVAFLSYAVLAHLHPVLALHAMLLPMNIFRLAPIISPADARAPSRISGL